MNYYNQPLHPLNPTGLCGPLYNRCGVWGDNGKEAQAVTEQPVRHASNIDTIDTGTGLAIVAGGIALATVFALILTRL